MPPFGPENPTFRIDPERQKLRAKIKEGADIAVTIAERILPHTDSRKRQATPKVLLQTPTDEADGTATRAWAERRSDSAFEPTLICTDRVRLDDENNVVREVADSGVVRAKLIGGQVMSPNGLPYLEPEHQLAATEMVVDTLMAIAGEVQTRRFSEA